MTMQLRCQAPGVPPCTRAPLCRWWRACYPGRQQLAPTRQLSTCCWSVGLWGGASAVLRSLPLSSANRRALRCACKLKGGSQVGPAAAVAAHRADRPQQLGCAYPERTLTELSRPDCTILASSCCLTSSSVLLPPLAPPLFSLPSPSILPAAPSEPGGLPDGSWCAGTVRAPPLLSSQAQSQGRGQGSGGQGPRQRPSGHRGAVIGRVLRPKTMDDGRNPSEYPVLAANKNVQWCLLSRKSRPRTSKEDPPSNDFYLTQLSQSCSPMSRRAVGVVRSLLRGWCDSAALPTHHAAAVVLAAAREASHMQGKVQVGASGMPHVGGHGIGLVAVPRVGCAQGPQAGLFERHAGVAPLTAAHGPAAARL